MKNLSEYISNLEFEYIISYSGLRGDKYRKFEEENKKKIKKIKTQIESARFIQKSKLKTRIKKIEDKTNIFNTRIITKKNEKHDTTTQICKLKRTDKNIKEIIDILNIEFKEQHIWMCPPIFRDAIVFYSKEKEIRGILQICFSCSSIINENEEVFDVDHKIFKKLKSKLIQIGHQIEDE